MTGTRNWDYLLDQLCYLVPVSATRRPSPTACRSAAARTINYVLTVVHSFYPFHAHFGRAPVINRFRCHRSGGRRWGIGARRGAP
jgi:hypothetical protein